MKRHNHILAVIPARGGPKGIPKKNIAPLSGRPLIEYSIDAAKHCPLVDRVIVSTNDLAIKSISQGAGAEVWDRSQTLSSDVALTEDVMSDILGRAQKEGTLPEVIVLLQPTSPLRTAEHVQSALEQFLASDSNSLMSVTPMEHSPYKSLKRVGKLLEPLFDAKSLSQPRALLPPVYRQNGAIYIVKTAAFLKEQTFFVSPCEAFVMKQEVSVDVETPLDLSLCEALLQQRNASGSVLPFAQKGRRS